MIDRMLALVDGRVVTLSDLDRARTLARLFGDPVTDDEDALLREVIEDRLIQEQVDQFPNLRLSEQDVVAYMRGLDDLDPAEELSEAVLREAVRGRLQRARYFEIRFRQFVDASSDEIAEYYRVVFVPEAQARQVDPIPSIEDVGEMIRANVVAEKTEREIEVWIDSLFRRSEIEVVH